MFESLIKKTEKTITDKAAGKPIYAHFDSKENVWIETGPMCKAGILESVAEEIAKTHNVENTERNFAADCEPHDWQIIFSAKITVEEEIESKVKALLSAIEDFKGMFVYLYKQYKSS